MERPKNHNVIGTKWVYKNKLDTHGQVIRNKARLVVQGYYQVEGLDYGEIFAPVARLESIRILLAFATSHNFILHQKAHYQKNIIGGLGRSVSTRGQLLSFCCIHSYVSHIEPIKVYDALQDEDWVQAMHEELHNFERNKVWSLVERPKNHNVIGTK